MTDELLSQRYARQMLLPEIGAAGQRALADSTAMLVGTGGLGGIAAHYLAAAGVGRLKLVDLDRIELSNLHRQLLYSDTDIGEHKASVAARTLAERYPPLQCDAVIARADENNLRELIDDAGVVLDCSDNFATRFAVNAACVAQGKMLISGAAIRYEGQVISLRGGDGASPCYRCLYPDVGAAGEACEDAGILPPVAGVIGSLQATEALKALLNLTSGRWGRLQVYDARESRWRSLDVPRDPDCPDCRDSGPKSCPQIRSL